MTAEVVPDVRISNPINSNMQLFALETKKKFENALCQELKNIS